MRNVVFERSEDNEFVLIYPKKTNLRSRLHITTEPGPPDNMTDDDLFVEFVKQMLDIDPSKRLNAKQALLHPWLHDVDSLDVTYHDN
jgi:serine/threonine protein kinase